MGSTLFTPYPPATRTKAEKVLNDFLATLNPDLKGDAKVYSQLEWHNRGEKYGTNGAAVLAFDGSWLYEVFNCYDCSKLAQATFNSLQSTLKANGFWYEIGEAWFLYVYED